MSYPYLTLIPSVPVWVEGDAFVFDRKFHDGLMHYVAAWPGRVRCLAWRGGTTPSGFGTVRTAAADRRFEVELLGEREPLTHKHLASAAVVLAAGDDYRQLHVATLCRELGIRCAYVIEYIPETRHQINQLEAPNPFVRWRRDLFLRGRERERRAAFEACDGLQANGMPAHDAYQSHGNCLLYFDTRMGRRSLIDDAALEARLATLQPPKSDSAMQGNFFTTSFLDPVLMRRYAGNPKPGLRGFGTARGSRWLAHSTPQAAHRAGA